MIYTAHDYQRSAVSWLIDRTILRDHEGGGLFEDPGLGKTVQTLTWFRALRMMNRARNALIVAPRLVCETVWGQECAKWEHTADLRVVNIKGTPTQRMSALSTPADIHLVNSDGIKWVEKQFYRQRLPWDALIVDESSLFKTWTSDRTKALRRMVPKFRKRLILTGTPSPNCVHDLFAQIFLIDRGRTLYDTQSKFRARWFHRGGFKSYKWLPNDGAFESITKRIRPLCLTLSAADHLDLPDLVVNDIWLDLDDDARQKYRQMEKELFLALDNGDELTPTNAGARYNACQQIASGGIYSMSKSKRKQLADRFGIPPKCIKIRDIPIHQIKAEAAANLISELQGKPVLVAFNYGHELRRLRHYFPRMEWIDGDTKGSEAKRIMRNWNEGKLHVFGVQSKAMSHGANLQYGPGRDVVWLGLPDELDPYVQLNARIYRQGVTSQVRIHRVLIRDTVEVASVDRINRKDDNQQAVLQSLKRYRKAMVV